MKQLIVQASDQNIRFDKYLAKNLPAFPRSHWKSQIESERVNVNGHVEFHPQYRLNAGDVIELFAAEYVPSKSANSLKLNVIYEDENILALSKPEGIAMQTGTAHVEGTLQEVADAYLASKYRVEGDPTRALLVHRLDKGTSGIVVFAKQPEVLAELAEAFATRKVSKQYLAVVAGEFPEELEISNYLLQVGSKVMVKDVPMEHSKHAVTQYMLVEYSASKKLSLVLCAPKTGRKHQLRAQLSAAGHPIIGDKKYGGAQTTRMFLHAWKLKFKILGKDYDLFANIPVEFRQYFDMSKLTLDTSKHDKDST